MSVISLIWSNLEELKREDNSLMKDHPAKNRDHSFVIELSSLYGKGQRLGRVNRTVYVELSYILFFHSYSRK